MFADERPECGEREADEGAASEAREFAWRQSGREERREKTRGSEWVAFTRSGVGKKTSHGAVFFWDYTVIVSVL